MGVSIMAFGSKSFIELLWRRQQQIKEVNSYLKYWSDVCFLCRPHHLHFHITAANWIHVYVSVRLVYPAWKVNEPDSDVCWWLTVKKSRSRRRLWSGLIERLLLVCRQFDGEQRVWCHLTLTDQTALGREKVAQGETIWVGDALDPLSYYRHKCT